MNKNVILIDDDIFALYINQEVIKPLLCEPLTTFLEAKEALDFISKCLDDHTQVLVFLDLNMPSMNGWQFLEELRSSRFISNIIVVIVTSSVDQRDERRAFNYPCVKGFITKPIEEKFVLALSKIENLSPFFQAAN